MLAGVAVPSGGEARREIVRLGPGTTLVLRLAAEPGAPPKPLSLRAATSDEVERGLAGELVVSTFLRPAFSLAPGGRAEVPHLAPGTYELWGNRPEGWILEPTSLDVPEVERHEVELRLRRE